MKKYFFILALLIICGNAFGQIEAIEKEPVVAEKTSDYWVYVRLEDRSGVTTLDDTGRSKAGDVVAVLPVNDQHIPSETEKKEWMIYKATLTEEQAQSMTESWEETDTRVDTIDIPKEDWENAEKQAQIKSDYRVVNIISENLVEKEVGSVIDVSGNIGSISVGGKEIDLTGEEGIIDTRHIAQVYEVAVNHEYQKPIAYRKRKVDLNSLGIPIKKGVSTNKVESKDIIMSVKTAEDFARYETNRKWYAYVKRPLKIVSNKIIGPAFAETVSTINKSGEDYNTLTLWEDAVDGDLVTETRQPTAECYDDDGDLTDEFIINGSTTNASYYMKVTVPEGEEFVLKATNLADKQAVVKISDSYTIVEKIRFTGWRAASSYCMVGGIVTEGFSDSYHDVTIRYNRIYNNTNIGNVQHRAISTADGNNYNIYIYGNFIYNIVSTGSGRPSYGIYIPYKIGAVYVYNNTVYNITGSDGFGIYGVASDDQVIKNNIVISTTTADFTFGTGNIHDYNASSDATANGANSLNSGSGSPPSTSDFVSVTGGSENLHLALGAVEIDTGVDLGSPYDYDIDGTQRSGTWDIGADEYVATAGGATNTIIRGAIIRGATVH